MPINLLEGYTSVKRLLDSPLETLLAGLALVALLLVLWLALTPVDTTGLVSVLLRFLHVAGAMVWVGLAVFVNFIQLRAVEEGDDQTRATVVRWIAPGVSAAVRHSSHLVVATGALLLITSGYLLGEWMFSTAVYVPTARSTLLWIGAAGGLVMWAAVNIAIRPTVKILLADPPADPVVRAAARARMKTYARLVLFLAFPVTFAMIAAAHLG